MRQVVHLQSNETVWFSKELSPLECLVKAHHLLYRSNQDYTHQPIKETAKGYTMDGLCVLKEKY